MAKLIALEWDTHEARFAVGNPRGNDVVVEQAFAVDLEGTSGELPSLGEIGDGSERDSRFHPTECRIIA